MKIKPVQLRNVEFAVRTQPRHGGGPISMCGEPEYYDSSIYEELDLDEVETFARALLELVKTAREEDSK